MVAERFGQDPAWVGSLDPITLAEYVEFDRVRRQQDEALMMLAGMRPR